MVFLPLYSPWMIYPYTIFRDWVCNCLPVFEVKYNGINLVTFHPHSFIFNFLQFLNGVKEIFLEGFTGNSLDCDIFNFFSCGYKDYQIIGSEGIFNAGICWFILVDGVNILIFMLYLCLVDIKKPSDALESYGGYKVRRWFLKLIPVTTAASNLYSCHIYTRPVFLCGAKKFL